MREFRGEREDSLKHWTEISRMFTDLTVQEVDTNIRKGLLIEDV